ncbi:energy-coupled thiamine transporter ThiT [Oscillospiraceae bacterium MB08-C2-2]|nr:energy-coupled thiamine transporter ThiT [Oscillospiraceae bacterium MB08-C2-2]
MEKNRTRILAECGIMAAMATLLSYIPIFEMPQGGSITLCSMVPLVVVSFRRGVKWGLLTGTVNGFIQMVLGFKNVLYATTIPAIIGCILLDYILAYTVIGASCVFGKGISNFSVRVAVGVVTTGLLRYLCSFLSGILIWGGYAPEGTPVWIYSMTYNASYMVPEIILTAVASVLLLSMLKKRDPSSITG